MPRGVSAPRTLLPAKKKTPEFVSRHMDNLPHEVDDFKTWLQQNDISVFNFNFNKLYCHDCRSISFSLSGKREETCSNDSIFKGGKLKEVQKILEDELQLRLASAKELNQSKRIIEGLQQSNSRFARAHLSILRELSDLKTQLKEKSSSDLNLASRLKEQEGANEVYSSKCQQ